MVTKDVRLWLRVEGACVLVLLATLYARAGGKWWVFLLFFLSPDISFVGYLGGSKAGAYAYNWAHCYLAPAVLGILSLRNWHAGMLGAFIWGAHIGFDRMLGYGLKYPEAFEKTHLGWIGKRAAENG